ncbi:MAG: hypothetical protein BroJett018_16180 [Chloroflexota bacterium]|nr:MAG: hypothetical protein BroJett018_16180 [Chloroflexota bacterium]
MEIQINQFRRGADTHKHDPLNFIGQAHHRNNGAVMVGVAADIQNMDGPGAFHRLKDSLHYLWSSPLTKIWHALY